MPNSSSSTPRPTLESQIYGCWMGKSIGGTLGLPPEGKTERLSFTFYDPIPTMAPPNDDLELQLVWLCILENKGAQLTREDFAQGWLQSIHYMWDEYGRCRWNLRRGVPASAVGTFENHFHAGMGSPIRSEIWGCLFINDPSSAAYYAALDASLDHDVEGIYGEAFFAAMQSLAAVDGNIKKAISTALENLPDSSETAQAVRLVVKNYEAGVEVWKARELLLAKHDNENFTYAPLNVAIAVWALLYGEGDFEASILLSVNFGYDTDSTGATVGATLGLALGIDQLPARWKEPIGDAVYLGPGILNLENAPKTLQDLTRRVVAQIGRLEKKSWSAIDWTNTASQVDLASLPGTIKISPLGSQQPVAWADGELPAEVKRAGGAEWVWDVATNESREIICLARAGAKLFIDNKLVIECPAGLPYVPATHRSAAGSRVSVKPGIGSHSVRLELGSQSPEQEASLILAYPNLHICPWTHDDIPHKALLA